MEYINTIQSSTILAISVPIAAPRIPIAGNPNKPKIKTAFAHTFTKREQAYTIVEMKDSKEHTAWGLSRLSGLDNDSPETGLSIARGRAEKALLKKLNHEKIQHPLPSKVGKVGLLKPLGKVQ